MGNIIRGIIARKEVQKLRLAEMEFLGMTRRPQTAKEIRDPNNPLRMRERVMKSRREERNARMFEFEAAKVTMEEDINEAEAEDIIEAGVRSRQDWIQEWKEMHNGKPPDKIDKYHERLN